MDAEGGRIVLVAVIDNLIKGAAGRSAEPQRAARTRRADGLLTRPRAKQRAQQQTAWRLVLKLGGELLEQPQDVERVAGAIARLAKRSSLVVVHGGGKEIDAALATAGIPKQQVDGLRVTDAPTLDVVVAVLAGAINTRLVAAVRRAGGKPVGLTGADATVATVKRAAPIVSVAGASVDLGLVGAPVRNGAPQLLTDLLSRGHVPIVACIGPREAASCST